jgi:hypothetical protein
VQECGSVSECDSVVGSIYTERENSVVKREEKIRKRTECIEQHRIGQDKFRQDREIAVP